MAGTNTMTSIRPNVKKASEVFGSHVNTVTSRGAKTQNIQMNAVSLPINNEYASFESETIGLGGFLKKG